MKFLVREITIFSKFKKLVSAIFEIRAFVMNAQSSRYSAA